MTKQTNNKRQVPSLLTPDLLAEMHLALYCASADDEERAILAARILQINDAERA